MIRLILPVLAVAFACSDTADTMLVAPPLAETPETPRPTGGTSGTCANEPGGATRLPDQTWDAVPSRTSASDGWRDDNGSASSKLRIVDDPTSPFPGSNHNVVAGLFNQGNPGGTGPFNVFRAFTATEQFSTLYICVVMKHSENFDNTNGNAGTKFLWPAGDEVQGAKTYVTFHGPNMAVGINQQGAVDREMGANVGGASAGNVVSRRGQWVTYEFLLKANSNNDTPNGELRIWIDNVKTHEYTNVNWQMGASRTWQSLSWNPTYGGGPNPVPHDQFEYIDNIRISGMR
ncbi:MAG TPA: hypothetical protein VIP11_20840 [Gemmatimonadaceae bacterium]